MLRPVFQSAMDSIIMGISEQQIIPEFAVYPNPANDRVKIINLNNEELEITLLSIDGKAILKKRVIHETELNVSDIPPGMYLSKALNDEGLVKVEKILINH